MRGPQSDYYIRLLNKGPQPYPQTREITGPMKDDGVRKFNLKTSTGGSGAVESGGGSQKSIYYIENKHDPETVIEEFFEVNPHTKQGLSDLAIHKRICRKGEEWKEASYEMFGPFYDRSDNIGNGGGMGGGTCPLCGEEYEYHLPTHLPCDSE